MNTIPGNSRRLKHVTRGGQSCELTCTKFRHKYNHIVSCWRCWWREHNVLDKLVVGTAPPGSVCTRNILRPVLLERHAYRAGFGRNRCIECIDAVRCRYPEHVQESTGQLVGYWTVAVPRTTVKRVIATQVQIRQPGWQGNWTSVDIRVSKKIQYNETGQWDPDSARI